MKKSKHYLENKKMMMMMMMTMMTMNRLFLCQDRCPFRTFPYFDNDFKARFFPICFLRRFNTSRRDFAAIPFRRF